MDVKYNPLLVFTTYNQLGMTKKCLEYACELGFDILVIDDCSIDGTQEYLANIKISAILKHKRQGLTDSWNRAYRYWKATDHSHLILCNNDVLIPKGAIENMLSDHALVVPKCNIKGSGYACKEQGLDSFEIMNGTMWVNPECEHEVQLIQDWIGFVKNWYPAKCWTGFCMCMNIEIIHYELPDGNLFDPKNINVGNDDDLAKRVQAYIALGSFVYHYKGRSFGGQIADRDNLNKDYGVQ